MLVPILTFLFLKDAEELRRSLLSWIPANRRPMVDSVVQDIHVMLVQYIRAIVILSAATAATYMTFFTVIGLPYSVLVSVLARAARIYSGIRTADGRAHHHLDRDRDRVSAHLVDYRLLSRVPYVPGLCPAAVSYEQRCELHPLLVLFGALAGESVGGLWGMFLSVPVLAILRIVIVRVMRAHRSRLEPVTNASSE